MQPPLIPETETEVTGEPWDALILGAGISGLVTADILLKGGCRRIAILDEYRHVGGNHLDRHISGYTFDLGSLIFFDNSPFFEHFPEIKNLYTVVDVPLGRLTPLGDISIYPISLKKDVLAKGPLEITRMVLSLAYARVFRSNPRNASEFAQFWIGKRFFTRSGLAAYMERFYGVLPERIEISFAQKRMTWISDAASFWGRLKWAMKRSKPPGKVQAMVRPYEGFSQVYDVVQRGLEERGATFFLGQQVDAVRKTEHGFDVICGTDRWGSPRLVGTIPLRRLLTVCGLSDAPELTSVALASLFFSFQGIRGFDYSILYNFSELGRWKRLTMHSDYYGSIDEREYFAVEVNMRSSDEDLAALAEDFLTSTRAFSLFQGDCRLEGSMATANAYPVYTEGSTMAAADAISALGKFGVEGFGRQGGFDYLQSTVAVTAAVRAALSDRSAKPTTL